MVARGGRTVPCARFVKNREKHLEKVMLARISQNILTCPTAKCFNHLDTEPYFKLGRKVALFGDRHQFRDERHGEKGWVIPTLGGEFFLSRRFGFQDGVMGGNLWFYGPDESVALEAAESCRSCRSSRRLVTTFQGGIASSGSKAGSDYLIAATYAEYCPTLREQLGERSKVPAGVGSIMEIIMNGRDLEALQAGTRNAILAAATTPGLNKLARVITVVDLAKPSFIFVK